MGRENKQQRLKEKVDFSFDIQDFILIDKYMLSYLDDRANNFEKNYSLDNFQNVDPGEARKHINIFVSPIDLDRSEMHPGHSLILRFLNRHYEPFTLPQVEPTVERLKFLLDIEPEEIESPVDFCNDFEADYILEIQDLWTKLYKLLQESPRLNLDQMLCVESLGCPIYYTRNTDKFILDTVINVVNTFRKYLPRALMHMDAFALIDPKYLEFSSGSKEVFAYYMDDLICIPEKVKPEDKEFLVFSINHELFHFIFAMMSLTSQLLWEDLYKEWVASGVKLSRPEGKNECEELFADTGAFLFCTADPGYITPPSAVISNTVKKFLEKEFSRHEETLVVTTSNRNQY